MRWDRDYVSYAGKHNHIIAGFDVFGYEDAQAVIRAAERAHSPVMLMINRDARKNLKLMHWSALLCSMANEAKVPVGVHLDHCSDLEIVRDAIDAGFTSVMYDGSKLPLEENIYNTIKACEWAHKKNVQVEAELGNVPYDELGETEIRFTSPKEVERFCKETPADWLAVSVGNVHRLLGRKVDVDFRVLQEIEAACSIPLVIHGASGLQRNNFASLRHSRVGKINVGTALRRAFGEALRDEVIKKPKVYDRQLLFRRPLVCVEEAAYQVITEQCQENIVRRKMA